MNCLEFRRQTLIDPLSHDATGIEHEAECPSCAAFARDARAKEIKLRALLRDVKAPEGLAERVQLAVRDEERAESRRRWWYAAAAGVFLAIGASMISLWTTTLERSGLGLAQAVVNHIEDESSHLREALPVSAGRIERVFARFGAELAGDIGQVNFAAECLMRARNGVHLVLPGKMGPITVFFMPGEMTDAPMPVGSARFAGEIVPTRWGSIAVVGESGEPLDGFGDRLAAAVRWPAGQAQAQAAASVDSGLVAGRLFDHLRIAQQ